MKKIVNRFQFDTIVVMSLGSSFLAHPVSTRCVFLFRAVTKPCAIKSTLTFLPCSASTLPSLRSRYRLLQQIVFLTVVRDYFRTTIIKNFCVTVDVRNLLQNLRT